MEALFPKGGFGQIPFDVGVEDNDMLGLCSLGVEDDGVPTLRGHMFLGEILDPFGIDVKEGPTLNGQTKLGEIFDLCTPLGSTLGDTGCNPGVPGVAFTRKHGECILLDIDIPYGLDLDRAGEQRSEAGLTGREPAPPPLNTVMLGLGEFVFIRSPLTV